MGEQFSPRRLDFGHIVLKAAMLRLRRRAAAADRKVREAG